MRFARQLLMRLARAVVVVLLVVAGSAALIRFAPGYLSDEREMDARYAGAARVELSAEAKRSASVRQIVSSEIAGWARGSLGISRQFEVPVMELIVPRLAVTGTLIVKAILSAWMLALAAALLSSAGRRNSLLWQAPAALLLAVPAAAMATLCLLGDGGGPVLVMTLLLAARDFKFLHQVLRKAWADPHMLHARAQGIGTMRRVRVYILPGLTRQLRSLATLSIITALSALVPVEVIFSVPGVGQLAWSAAMNRDLPVLLAVTMIMAVAVTLAGMVSDEADQAGSSKQWAAA